MELKQDLYLSQSSDLKAQRLLSIKKDIKNYRTMIQLERLTLLPDSANIRIWQDSLFHLIRDSESIHEVVFSSPSDSPATITTWNTSPIKDIQSCIQKNEALIEYSISKPDRQGTRRMYIFLATRNKSEFFVGLLDSSYSEYLKTIEKYLSRYDPIASEENPQDSLNTALSGLYKILLGPVCNVLEGASLIIIPDESLINISFDALIRECKGDHDKTDHYRYLIEDHDIRILPTSSLMNRSKSPPFRHPAQVRIFAQSYSNDKGAYLPAVEKEIKSIAEITRGSEVPLNQPKEIILREMMNCDVIHFALHSHTAKKDQSSSYLLLNDQKGSSLNNCLFDFEIEHQKLQNDLVVLNSCESGSGRFYSGEGLLSLSRSFILAGSCSLVQTLWPVDDQAGARIIEKFYVELSHGKSKSESLRNAKLYYLETTTPSFRHPYYWAGYQLVGNNNKIRFSNRKQTWMVTCIPLVAIIFCGLMRKKMKTSRSMKLPE